MGKGPRWPAWPHPYLLHTSPWVGTVSPGHGAQGSGGSWVGGQRAKCHDPGEEVGAPGLQETEGRGQQWVLGMATAEGVAVCMDFSVNLGTVTQVLPDWMDPKIKLCTQGKLAEGFTKDYSS